MLLLSCSGNRDEAGFLRYNEAEGIRSLDPVQAFKRAHIWVTRLWAETLFEMNNTGHVAPWLCEGYRWTGDLCTLRLGIRKDILFHEDPCFGTERSRVLTASDVVYSLKRAARQPASAWLFVDVRKENDTLCLKADGDTVEIRLRRPQVSFLKMLATPQASIVPPEVEKFYGREAWRHPVGTGPFRFQSWFPEQALTFIRYQHHWSGRFEGDSGRQMPCGVKISFVRDRQSEVLLFLKGKLDFLAGNDRTYAVFFLGKDGQLKEEFASEGITLRQQEVLATEYLGFNLEGKCVPCRRAQLRRLVATALDKEHLVNVALEGLGKAADASLVPPTLRKHVAQVLPGQSDGSGELHLMTTPPYSLQAALVKEMLERHGFKLSVGVRDGATHKTAVANGEYDFFRASWIADFADAENFYSVFYSGFKAPAGPNYTRFSHPVYDKLFERLQKTEADEERMRLFARLDSVLSVEMPAVPLYYDVQLLLMGPHVVQMPVDASGHPVFRAIRMK